MNSFIKVITFISLAGTAGLSSAGWVARVLPTDDPTSPARAVINYSADPDEGHTDFKSALLELAGHGHAQRLDLITLHGLMQDNRSFADEINSSLQTLYPTTLAEAMGSYGNINNPKLLSLGQMFDGAVLSSPTVEAINGALNIYGLEVAKASHEKLQVVGEGEGRRLACYFIFLDVGPIAPSSQHSPR